MDRLTGGFIIVRTKTFSNILLYCHAYIEHVNKKKIRQQAAKEIFRYKRYESYD